MKRMLGFLPLAAVGSPERLHRLEQFLARKAAARSPPDWSLIGCRWGWNWSCVAAARFGQLRRTGDDAADHRQGEAGGQGALQFEHDISLLGLGIGYSQTFSHRIIRCLETPLIGQLVEVFFHGRETPSLLLAAETCNSFILPLRYGKSYGGRRIRDFFCGADARRCIGNIGKAPPCGTGPPGWGSMDLARSHKYPEQAE